MNIKQLFEHKIKKELSVSYTLRETDNQSSFFKEVWTDTRKMFTEKAEAWSVDKIVSLNHP